VVEGKLAWRAIPASLDGSDLVVESEVREVRLEALESTECELVALDTLAELELPKDRDWGIIAVILFAVMIWGRGGVG
jgi:hypothetical protein